MRKREVGRRKGGGGDKSNSPRFIFFFQAEDGIRDIGVTGVQTCALPISGTMVTATKNFHTPSKIRPSSQVFLLTTPEKTMVTPFPAYTLAAGTYECNTIDIFLF